MFQIEKWNKEEQANRKKKSKNERRWTKFKYQIKERKNENENVWMRSVIGNLSLFRRLHTFDWVRSKNKVGHLSESNLKQSFSNSNDEVDTCPT